MSYYNNFYTGRFAKHWNILKPKPAMYDPVIQSDREASACIPVFTFQYGKHVALLSGSVLGVALCAVLLYYTSNSNQQENSITSILPVSLKDTGLVKVVRLAEAFKTTLKEDQVAQLQLAYSKSNAVRWSNFPQAFSRPNRVGLALGTLTPVQFAAFKDLMTAVLSQVSADEGYNELKGILAADDYIAKVTGKTAAFGSGNFYIALLGQPSTTGLWELQYGGHHIAFSNTYKSGQLSGVTPAFRGVEPMTSIPGNDRNYQPMEAEQNSFATLIEGLSEVQKTGARLSTTFSDLLLGPGRDGAFPNTKQGVRLGETNSSVQKQVLKAIALYVDDLEPASAKQVMDKYTAELPDTYLSYSGSGTMNQQNDYVRLDGPSIWLEYSVQPGRDFPGTTHPHSVWRDRKTDYGGN